MSIDRRRFLRWAGLAAVLTAADVRTSDREVEDEDTAEEVALHTSGTSPASGFYVADGSGNWDPWGPR